MGGIVFVGSMKGFERAAQQGLRDQGLRADDRRPGRRPHRRRRRGRSRRRSPRSTTTTCPWSTATVASPESSPGPTRWPRSSPTTRRWQRAIARIDLGAVERNCARLQVDAGRGRRALRSGQGRRLRPRRRRVRRGRAGRRRDPAGGCDRGRGRAGRPPPPARPTADDGGTDPGGRRRRVVGRLGGRGLARGLPRASSPTAPAPRGARPASTSSTTAAWAGSATPTRREVMALARACAESPDLELAGVWTHFATADEPDSGFFDEQLERFDGGCRGGSQPSSPRSPSTPPTAPPSSATLAPTSTWPAAASPSTASIPSSATRPSAASSPALSPALLRGRREALRGRRQRRLRPDLAGARPTPGSGCCRSATATGCGAASPTTPRCWSAAAATRSSAPSRWTT